jgi:hypothetical protein
MSFKKLLPVAILTVFFFIGAQYLIYISGSADIGSNVSAAYQAQHNTTRDINITTISMVKFLPPIFMILVIVIALGWAFKKR